VFPSVLAVVAGDHSLRCFQFRFDERARDGCLLKVSLSRKLDPWAIWVQMSRPLIVLLLPHFDDEAGLESGQPTRKRIASFRSRPSGMLGAGVSGLENAVAFRRTRDMLIHQETRRDR